MSNNLRGNREPGLAHPHEVGDVVKGSASVEKNVQEKGGVKTTEDSEAEAKRLFAKMNKELREQREGLSKEEGQKIKMDKNSSTYKEWIKVTNNILRDSLAEEQTDLTTQIKKAEHAKADAEVAVLKDKLIRNDKQLKRAEAAIKEWNELNSRKMEVADERKDLVIKSSRLGGEQPAFAEKLRVVDAEAEVVNAEEDAVAAMAVGASEELLGDGGISGVIENESFFAQAEVQKERNEMFRDGKGTDIIRLYFSDQLAKDAKKGIKGRDLVFTETVNKLVGDDVVFANLLVKNSSFKEMAQKLFDAKVGIVSSAEMTKAAANLHLFLENARSVYETMLRKEEPPAISEEGLEYIPAEAVKSVDTLRQSIDNKREELQKAQDLLKGYSWYQFKDKNQKKEEIKAIVEELNQSTQILLDLGEEIISENKAAVVKSDYELADKIQEVRNEVAAGADYASRKYDSKYNKLVTALLTLLASTNVTQDTSGRRHIEEPVAAVKPVRMAEKTGLKNLASMPRVSGGMSVGRPHEEGFSAVDMSTVPPALPGYESGGPAFTMAESYSPAATEEVTTQRHGKGAKRFETAAPKVGAERISTIKGFDTKIAQTKEVITDLQRQLDQIPPVTDISTLTAAQERQLDKVEQLKDSLQTAKNELTGLEKGKIDLQISGEQPIAKYAGENIDFSNIKKIYDIGDLASTEDDSRKITKDFDNRLPEKLLGANAIVRGIQQVAGASADLKVMSAHLDRAKQAKKVYEQAAFDIANFEQTGKTVKSYTKEQVRAGLYLVDKQIEALEAKIPAKEAKTAHVDAFEVLSGIIKANENRTAVRKGERGIDVRALYGEDGAVRIMEDALKLKNDSAKLTQIRKAITKINIVLKDKDAEPSLRADAKALKGAADDLISELTTPTSPDIAWQSSPGKVSSELGQEIKFGVAGAEAARAGREQLVDDSRQKAEAQMERNKAKADRIADLGLNRDDKGNLRDDQGRIVDDRGTPLSEEK